MAILEGKYLRLPVVAIPTLQVHKICAGFGIACDVAQRALVGHVPVLSHCYHSLILAACMFLTFLKRILRMLISSGF